MKKNYLFALALGSVALMGCSQDELAEVNPEIKSNFTAELEIEDSRTTLNDANKVQWVVEKDYVSLFEKVNINAKYQVGGVDANGTATLKYVNHIEKTDYQSLTDGKYYAAYPYGDENTIAVDGTMAAPIPASYIYKDKESCITSALMVARSDNKKLRFTNAQGIIRLKLNAETPHVWGKIQSVSFTSTSKFLNGIATMSWQDTETPLAEIKTGVDANKTLTINLDESLKKDLPSKQSGNYSEYYFPIIPTTFVEEDLTMYVTFANDQVYDIVIPKAVTIGRKEIVTLKHTIGADDFTADIEDEAFSKEVEATTITNAFKSADGTDITEKITNIIFGKIEDYPDIVNNHTATQADGISVYQILNTDNTYNIYYLSDKKISAPTDSYMLFYEMKGLTEFDASNLDMSKVENAKCMFTNCENLVSIKGTENWDMSNVTNMQSIFYGCNKLESIDVSNWDTSNVTNMRMVFFRCYKLSDEALKGVENWDVSNVTTFHSMFKHAYGLTSLDLSKWDTSNATNMTHMFANIGDNLTTLDLSSFNTSKVIDMSWMFYSANKLTTIYVGDGWTTEALDSANPTCFYNNQSLVGGSGTKWLDVCDMPNANRPWESSAKLDYAIVDGGTQNPGLLTYKSNN